MLSRAVISLASSCTALLGLYPTTLMIFYFNLMCSRKILFWLYSMDVFTSITRNTLETQALDLCAAANRPQCYSSTIDRPYVLKMIGCIEILETPDHILCCWVA